MIELTEERRKTITRKFRELQDVEFNQRLERLLQLDSIRSVEIDAGARYFSPSDSIEPFVREAADGWIHGLYRSCIFSCATGVHHILQEKVLQEEGYGLQRATKLGSLRFRQLLAEANKIQKLQVAIDDAKWLITVRNKVGAHPRFVRAGRARSEEELRFEVATMVEAANDLLDLLSPQARKLIQGGKVRYRGETITFREALNSHHRIGAEVVWHQLQFHLIRALALEAYRRLYNVMRRLEVYVITPYHTRRPY